jgi:LacI family transcriptional regulator
VEGRPTIYDVASEAGVAPSTVSRAYVRPGRVNAHTARLIFEAAERIGYRSERLDARPLRATGQTKALGLVISDVTNPFYGPIISGAYEAAPEAGFMLILSHTTASSAAERQAIETELQHVDGLVIASSRTSDSALRTIAKQKALVLLNRTIPEVCCVVTDNPRGTRRVAEHLGMLGHDSILYLAGPEASWSDGTRWRALREAGLELELDVRRIGPNDPTILAGFRAPLHQMGVTGVHNCIAVTHGAQPSAPPLVLPVRLVERASTAHRRRYNTSPARGTTSVSGSAANAPTSMVEGSR